MLRLNLTIQGFSALIIALILRPISADLKWTRNCNNICETSFDEKHQRSGLGICQTYCMCSTCSSYKKHQSYCNQIKDNYKLEISILEEAIPCSKSAWWIVLLVVACIILVSACIIAAYLFHVRRAKKQQNILNKKLFQNNVNGNQQAANQVITTYNQQNPPIQTNQLAFQPVMQDQSLRQTYPILQPGQQQQQQQYVDPSQFKNPNEQQHQNMREIPSQQQEKQE